MAFYGYTFKSVYLTVFGIEGFNFHADEGGEDDQRIN